MWNDVFAIMLAYSMGCFATGYYLVRASLACDIREVESGVTGALNVSRVLGFQGFIFTASGDFLKGILALLVAQWLAPHPVTLPLCLIAVVLGHNFPAQLGFRGGNGLATASGAMLVLDWRLFLAQGIVLLGAQILCLLLVRYTTLPIKFYTPSKIMVISTPLTALALGRDFFTVAVLMVVVCIIMFTIRQNLRRSAIQ